MNILSLIEYLKAGYSSQFFLFLTLYDIIGSNKGG